MKTRLLIAAGFVLGATAGVGAPIQDANILRNNGNVDAYDYVRHGEVTVRDGQCQTVANARSILSGSTLANQANGYSEADCLALNLETMPNQAFQDCRDLANSYLFDEGTTFDPESTRNPTRAARQLDRYYRSIERIFKRCARIEIKSQRIAEIQASIDELDPSRRNYQLRVDRKNARIATIQEQIQRLTDEVLPNAIANTERTKELVAEFADEPNPVPLPGMFSITAPEGFIATATPTATWEASPNAETYDVTIARDSLCQDVQQVQNDVVGTSLVLQPLSEGEYTICIRARNATGTESALNTGLTFVYDITPPGAFDIINPPTTVASTSTKVEWVPAVDAEKYDLVIAVDSACNSPVQVYSDLTLAEQMITLVEGQFFACVDAIDRAGNRISASNDGYGFTIDLTVAEPRIIFTTQSIYVNDGDSTNYPPSIPFFGSTEQADYYCTSEAYDSGLIEFGTWDYQTTLFKALISGDDSDDMRDRIDFSRPFVNTRGELVANGAADFFSGSLLAPLNVGPFGNDLSQAQFQTAWTGSSGNGTGSTNCSDWLEPGELGLVGDINATSSAWISTQLQSCFSQARFYCVDQR